MKLWYCDIEKNRIMAQYYRKIYLRVDKIMRYAIVDLEWIKKPYINLIQIGGIMYDEDHKEISRYYSVCRPNKGIKLKQRDIECTDLSVADVMGAVNHLTAIKGLLFWLTGCRSVIVWGKDTLKLLDSILQRYSRTEIQLCDIKDKYKCFKKIEFYCRKYGIEMKEPIRNAVNDCLNTFEVYRALEKNRPAFIALRGSKVFHRIGCRYIKGKDTHIFFQSISEAESKGFCPCRSCAPDTADTFTRSYRAKWDRDDIITCCDRFGFDCKIDGGIIFIDTKASSWYFEMDSSSVKLYHSGKYNKRFNCEGQSFYHLQKKNFSDPVEAIKYIGAHDGGKSYA